MKRFFVVCLLALLECGCGHTGALYLPHQDAALKSAAKIPDVRQDKGGE